MNLPSEVEYKHEEPKRMSGKIIDKTIFLAMALGLLIIYMLKSC